MPHNILMSKIRCDSPNKKGTAIHNRNHLIYIATREGTDLTPLENETSLEFEREMSNSKDYLKYIHDRPRSQGLFGNLPSNQVNDIKFMSKTVYNVSKKQNVYRGIISLDPRDAQDLGYCEKEKWNTYLKSIMPDIAKQFDIPIDKLKWVAAYHAEAGHPHVHYMFWSDGPMIKKPFIHTSVQNKCRELLSGKMFEEERHNKAIDKTVSRDLIAEFGKDIVEKDIDIIRRITPGIINPKIPNKLPYSHLNKTSEEIMRLLPMLSGHGSLKYKYMPAEVKKQLSVITQTILLNKNISAEYDKYMESVSKVFMTYSPAKRRRTAAHPETNAIEDLNKRLGNIILKGIKPLLSLVQSADALSDFDNINTDASLPDLPNQELFDKAVSLATWDENARKNYKAKKTAGPEKPKNPPQEALENDDSIWDNTLAMYDIPDENESFIDDTSMEYYDTEPDDNFVREESSHIPEVESIKGSTNRINIFDSMALDFYNNSMETTNSSELYKLGKRFLNTKSDIYDLDKAISCFKKSADLRNNFARISLGKIFSSKDLGKMDIPLALEYLNAAAQSHDGSPIQGNDLAFYQLGRIFFNKDFEVYDINKAISCFEQSASLGNNFARISLGKIFSSKELGKMDISLALEYLNAAAEPHDGAPVQGNALALYQLGRIFFNKDLEVYDLDKAISCFKESASLGNNFARISLGKIFSSKELGKMDISLALEYLNAAAEPHDGAPVQGNDLALYQLGQIFSNKDFKVYDLNKAISCFKESASLGNTFAQLSLGKIYSSEDSGKIDISLALNYLNAAAKAGNDFALLKLGNLYLWGKCVPQNVEKGRNYLTQALEQGNPYAQDCLNLYETVRLQYAVNCSFRIIQNFFNSLSYTNDRAATANAARQFDLSKKAIREEQLKNQHKHTYKE